MTLAQNEMCLADAVEDWWDNNIEKVKKKIGRDRWINELEIAARSNSDYLQKAVSSALATKKYDWSTYDIINHNTQDDIAEILANLAYQDLVNDDEWRSTRWDSFEESHKRDNIDKKKLEARIVRLERMVNESINELDIDGDVYDRLASMLHSMDVVKMHRALKMGADPNMSSVHQNDGNGCTALRAAAILGEYDVAKLLIDAGADVNMKDTVGKTPLDYAIENGYEDIIDLLLNSGARQKRSLRRW